jgi:hypothetical protein
MSVRYPPAQKGSASSQFTDKEDQRIGDEKQMDRHVTETQRMTRKARLPLLSKLWGRAVAKIFRRISGGRSVQPVMGLEALRS